MADPLGLVSSVGTSALRPGAIQTPKPPGAPDAPGGPGSASNASFKDVLMKNVEQVNRLQQDAQVAIEDLVAGRRDDAANVMMAKQKADLAFQMLLQVRNKLVSAYDEIKQMRV